MRFLRLSAFVLPVLTALAGCSAAPSADASSGSADTTDEAVSCSATKEGDTTVIVDAAHQTIRYLPTRLAVQAIWYGVQPANFDDFGGCPSNVTGSSPFCKGQSAVRYRLAPAALTADETAALTKRFGAGFTVTPMDFTVDATTTHASFVAVPGYDVFGASGSGDPDVTASGDQIIVTGWVKGGAPLSLLRTLQHQQQGVSHLTVGVKTGCSDVTTIEVDSLDWSAAPAEKILDSSVAFDPAATVATSLQRPSEQPTAGTIAYEIANWASSEPSNRVAPTQDSYVAFATAAFAATQPVLDGFGTPAIGSSDLTKMGATVDDALTTFTGAYLAANGAPNLDPKAVLNDLVQSQDNNNDAAAAAARVPACLNSGFLADALRNIHRSVAIELPLDSAIVDQFNGAL